MTRVVKEFEAKVESKELALEGLEVASRVAGTGGGGGPGGADQYEVGDGGGGRGGPENGQRWKWAMRSGCARQSLQGRLKLPNLVGVHQALVMVLRYEAATGGGIV